MTIVWSATSPTSGRFESSRETEAPELFRRVDELRAAGSGYVEAGPASQELPYLTLSFKDDQAVIERFNQDGSMSVLLGDGTTPEDADVYVPTMDDPDPAWFSGAFASTVERGVTVLRRFLDGAASDDLGEWFDL